MHSLLKNLKSFIALRRGQRYIRKGLPEKAITIFETAIEQNPDYSFLYLHLGHALAQTGDLEKTREQFQRLSQIDAKNAVVPLFLGKILVEAGIFHEAISLLQHSLELDKANQLAWNYLAIAHLGHGNIEEFQKILQQYGISENHRLQINLILLLEKNIRRWDLQNELQSSAITE